MNTYISELNKREARPRSKRLRRQGASASGGAASTVVVSGGGGGSAIPTGDGHTHQNLRYLDQVTTDANDYLYLTQNRETTDPDTGESINEKQTHKVKAGYADKAYDLDDDSPINDRFLRKDRDEETEYSLGVGGDLTVKSNTTLKGILTAMGNAILQSAATVWGLLTAQGGLVVQKFLKIGDFVSGMTGGYIDEKGDAELNSLILRDHLSVPEVRYNRITYFEGYNLISPGGGLKIEDYTINEDGTITVVPRLEEGEPCGQFVDDFLLGYYHNKTASGDFAGFQKVQFIVTSVDYDAKTFVMRPRFLDNYKIAKNMVLGQTGNRSNPERQTYTVIDTRDGNNCITFYDHVNEFDPKSAHEMAWFGKKKGRTVNGIDATSYSAVLKNIIMTGRIFQVDSITGEDIRVPIDKGAYVKGQQYAYYDRVTYQGSLWLCISEAGTTQEPSSTESAWLEEVQAGKSITSYAHWDASQTPYPANASLTFANRLWISNKETSEPPLGLVKAGGAYVKYHDENGNEGYVLRHPETQSEDWNLWFDFSGIKDGESIDVQYSSDTVSWHATFTTGDLYMRQRKGDGQWSGAMRIVGEKGQDGPYQDYQFTKNKSTDTQPTTGWQDAPPSLAEDEYLWMRTGWVIPPKTEPDAWAVVRLSGPKGKDGESNYLADLDNEMDSIPLSSEGKTTQSWTLTTTASLYYGQTRLTLTSITTNAASPITATANASTGVVTFTIASGQTVPERSAISITIKAPNGSELIERTLIYTLAGVKAGATGATGAAGTPGSNGADAVIYSLLPSVNAVARKKDGSYSVSSVSCRRMKRIGNAAATVTTEGTLKRSIDGGSEVVIANDATTASSAFTKSVKYIFYDGNGTLVDVETIPLVADGTDGTNGTNGTNGKDGVSITNLGHWSTSLGTVPKMSLVTMGGRSWLSKVATANPPLGTLTTASGRRITVKTQGGQVVYALSGKVNTSEWELLTEDSRGLSLVPTISSLQQTKLGWLNPSGYLVRACQQVGSVNLPITKYYLTTWAISSTGVKSRIISPTVTGEQAVTASKGYTQFITRMYGNYTDAYNWTDNHMAECTVGVSTDGADGQTGRTGSEPRPRGEFKPGNAYVWDDTYHDIIIYNGHVYKVKNYGASVTVAPTNVSGDTNWLPAQEFEFVATNLLLSDEVYTDKLTVTKVKAQSSDGTTTCTIDGETGKLTAKNAEFEGKIKASSGTIAGLRISNNSIGYDRYTESGVLFNGASTVKMDKDELTYDEDELVKIPSGDVNIPPLLSPAPKRTQLGAGYIKTTIDEWCIDDKEACNFIAGKYGLKVSTTGIYKTNDGGKTWSLLDVS